MQQSNFSTHNHAIVEKGWVFLEPVQHYDISGDATAGKPVDCGSSVPRQLKKKEERISGHSLQFKMATRSHQNAFTSGRKICKFEEESSLTSVA
ncbi:hypothetical protein TNCV_422121 [Trichonephila clavipes]|nr:hypothetical protein TNCV_422121 [Trichonephila clavipes]